MKFVHFCGLTVHSLIATTHAHECWTEGNANLHKILITVAYFILALVQTVALYLVLRKGKREEPPVI